MVAAVEESLGLSSASLSLRLSHLYWVVFPEDRRVTLRAHKAEVDVIMAIRLILTYLRRALNITLPGKIDGNFSLASKGGEGGWHMGDEEASEILKRLKEVTADGVHQV
jgi:hypothetical protein